jgi:hypothetical protein
VLFLGDSKTYCGIHPELLDPLLQTSSLNLAVFAHWFPTQLALVQDIAPLIPKGTTVVWSIGAINFELPAVVQRIYPVGFGNALRFVVWGLPPEGLADNLLFYHRPLFFLSGRGELRNAFFRFLDEPLRFATSAGIPRPISSANTQAAAPSTNSEIETLKAEYEKDPRVAHVGLVRDGSKTTSLTLFFQRGSYFRIELDPSYFRQKQKEFVSPMIGFSPALWQIFEEILKTFKAHGINVVVNELEEAPFTYRKLDQRLRDRTFMQSTVRRKVEEFGFRYTRVDFDRLTDEDYFDYNHLNSRGAETFTPMLAEQIRPYVQKSSSMR